MSMKKFKLKHIALGLALAGYISGSALAAIEATTKVEINGHRPILKGTINTNAPDHTISVTTYKGSSSNTHGTGEPITVGDRIVVSYNLGDLDGDKEGVNGSGATLKFWYKILNAEGTDVAGDWLPVPTSAVAVTTVSTPTTPGAVTLTLPDEMAGAAKIGALIQEKTTYGLPNVGKWLQISDLFAGGTVPVPTEPGETDPTDPGDTGGSGGGNEGGEVGPTTPIIPDPEKVNVGIFKKNGTTIDYTVDYSRVADKLTATPKVDDEFAVVVWPKSQTTPTDANLPLTQTYTWQWALKGTGTAAGLGNQDLSTAETVGASSATYKIGKNAEYEAGGATPITGVLAGAQGYNLYVSGTPKN